MKLTIGQLVDILSIVNIKIYMLEDKKRNLDSNNNDIAEATKKTNQLNVQRNEIIDSLDFEMNELAGGKKQKLFGSNKMYGKE